MTPQAKRLRRQLSSKRISAAREAAPITEELRDGYAAALTNFTFIANAVVTTKLSLTLRLVLFERIRPPGLEAPALGDDAIVARSSSPAIA